MDIDNSSDRAAAQDTPPTQASAPSGEVNSKGTTGPKTKAKAKAKKKHTPEETHRCFHCQAEGTKMMCCSQCHIAWYCGKACQKKHWKLHKRACSAAVAVGARRATLRREATAARGGGKIDKATCVICVGPVVAPVELPCGHAYCGGCLAELRAKKVAQACPLCREELPPSLDRLFDLGFRANQRITGMVERGEVLWTSLPKALQEEMDEVVAMLTEAAAQGHIVAQAFLSNFYAFGWGVVHDQARAVELCTQAALQGHAQSQYNAGIAYRDGFGCEQSHERAVEWWAKATEQGFPPAQNALSEAYQGGHGVPQSFERSVELLKLSAAQGDTNALMNLARSYEGGFGADQSFAEARRLFELAVENGETDHAPGHLEDLNAVIRRECALLG